MGRKPTVNTNLPRGMRARKRGDKTYYYYDASGKPRKEIPLGQDYVKAVQEWSKLEIAKIPKAARPTFAMAAARYTNEVIPTKATNTQNNDWQKIKFLLKFFGGKTPHHSKKSNRNTSGNT